MRIYTFTGNENWICDRFAEEWVSHNGEVSSSPEEADIVWIISPWLWQPLPLPLLQEKKVVVTIHHLVREKFTKMSLKEFLYRDAFVDIYHVPCEQTKSFIERITKKPIFVIPFWVNQDIWYPITDKNGLKASFDLDPTKFLIGSFQRDTEGHDLVSPKLEKGPDLFCDIVEKMYSSNKNIEVVLAGWRRQYVMRRLSEKNIKFHYYELPSFETLNKLYNILDLYLVSARCEGGPQAIVECAATETPIISTDVGIASKILSPESIYQIEKYDLAKPDVNHAKDKVKDYYIPKGFDKFAEMFANPL